MLIELQKSQKVCHGIIQKQLQMSMMNENLKKDICRRKTYNSIIMEYEKIINLLDNTPNQPSKFKTKNWVKINGDSRGRYNTNSQIKSKTSMLKSSLCGLWVEL